MQQRKFQWSNCSAIFALFAMNMMGIAGLEGPGPRF